MIVVVWGFFVGVDGFNFVVGYLAIGVDFEFLNY
jgi:hypothetical protein